MIPHSTLHARPAARTLAGDPSAEGVIPEDVTSLLKDLENPIDDLCAPIEVMSARFEDDGSEYGPVIAQAARRAYEELRRRLQRLSQAVASLTA